MVPLVILGVSFLSALALRRALGYPHEYSTPGRFALAVVFLLAGISHFIFTAKFVEMLPAFIPQREGIILTTGVLEILGAVGLMIPRFARVTGNALILFLVCVFPANVYSAFARVDMGGSIHGPIYLLFRIPLQMVFLLWAYRCTGQTWFIRDQR